MNLFGDRLPIPTVVTQQINPDMTLGEELGRQAKQGIVREVEVGVVLEYRAAKSLRDWLTDKLKAIETQVEQLHREEQANANNTSTEHD